jgi:hypothetical protein
MSDYVDMVGPDVMDAMRVHVDACEAATGQPECEDGDRATGRWHSRDMSDAEVLEYMDRHSDFPGGAAGFNEECGG